MLHRPEGSSQAPRREPGADWQGTAYDRRWEAYTEATLALLLERLEDAPPPPEVRILDVGCGTGMLLERVARRHSGARLVGVDPSTTMLARASRRLRGAGNGFPGLVQGASEALPFAPGSFDVVVSSSSLHFWPDPASGLREIARVLGPGGRLLLLDWSGDPLHMRLLDHWLRFRDPRHQRVLRREELGALVEAAGFHAAAIGQRRSHALWNHHLVDTVLRGPPLAPRLL